MQAFVRIIATSATRRSRSAARWNHTVVRCTVASSTSLTSSDATRSTCAKSVVIRLVDRSYTTPISSKNIRPVQHCFEPTTNATSSSLALLPKRQRQTDRVGLSRHHQCFSFHAISRLLPAQSTSNVRSTLPTRLYSDCIQQCPSQLLYDNAIYEDE